MELPIICWLQLILSAKCPVFVAPAMDLDMFAHPSTQKNIAILKEFRKYIIEPGEGNLASGLEGKGRMEEPENIVEIVVDFFNRKKKLLNKTFLVTAGQLSKKLILFVLLEIIHQAKWDMPLQKNWPIMVQVLF